MMIGSLGRTDAAPSWIQQLVHASGGTPLVGVKTISYAFMLIDGRRRASAMARLFS